MMNTITPTAFAQDEELAALRVPPHSVESEQSVLGGMLINNQAWDHVSDLLADSDFYRYDHKLIYASMSALINAGKPADVITVFDHLQNLDKAQDAGGLSYLNALAQCVPSATNIRRYAEVVRERAVLRKMIAVSDEAIANALRPAGRPVTQILDEFETKALQIAEQGARHKKIWHGLDELMAQALDGVIANADRGGVTLTGISTGFDQLDTQTSGLQPGDLVILAARPSMGKTALALNIAEHVAANEGLPVAVFSMEMGSGQLAMRLMGSAARVDQTLLRSGRLSDDDWSRLSETVERLSKAKMFIDETGALNPNELRARARRKARECGGKLGLIVVDYLQLMTASEDAGGASSENRATVIGEISRGLKALAKELQCPVIALSQLNRAVETRPDKRPLMSDLRESGAIEQDADVIMFIYRDDYYNKESAEPGVAEVILAKQRNGPVGTVKLGFLKPLTRFVNLHP